MSLWRNPEPPTQEHDAPIAGVIDLSNRTPRVPVLLLLDVSRSMEGEPLEQLNSALELFVKEVSKNQEASQAADICVLSFADDVQEEHPFAPIENFRLPALAIRGGTKLGQAVLAALDAIEERQEVYRQARLTTFKPWLFILSDGETFDSLTEARERIEALERDPERPQICVFPLAVQKANMEALSSLSTQRGAMKLQGLNFRELFLWIKETIVAVSQSVPGEKTRLPPVDGWADVRV
jgi:uncharacterized protein YegL